MASNLNDMSTPFFVGLFLMGILYGFIIEQVVWYFSVYPRDVEWHFLLVMILILFDTLHVIFSSISAFYAIFSWRDSALAGNVVSWSLPTSFALTYTITFIVQCFFLVRIWILSLSNNRAVTAGIAFLVVFQLAAGMAVIVEQTKNHLPDVDSRLVTSIILQLSASLAADLAITSTFVFYLYRGRSAIDHANGTNSAIKRLISYTISTGLITSLITFINLVLFISAPSKFYWIAPQIISSQLYVISMLASLNSRRSVREMIDRTSSLKLGILGLPTAALSRTKVDSSSEEGIDGSQTSSVRSGDSVEGEHDSALEHIPDLLSLKHDSLHKESFRCNGPLIKHGLAIVKDSQPNFPPGSKLTLDVSIPSGKISPSPAMQLRSPACTVIFSPISPSAALSPISLATPRTPYGVSWGRMPQTPARAKSAKSNKSARTKGTRDSSLSFVSSSAFTAHTFNTTRRLSTGTSARNAGSRQGLGLASPSTRMLPPLPVNPLLSDIELQPREDMDAYTTALVKLSIPPSDGVLRIAGINIPRPHRSTPVDTDANDHEKETRNANSLESASAPGYNTLVRVMAPQSSAFAARGRLPIGSSSGSSSHSSFDSASPSCSPLKGAQQGTPRLPSRNSEPGSSPRASSSMEGDVERDLPSLPLLPSLSQRVRNASPSPLRKIMKAVRRKNMERNI